MEKNDANDTIDEPDNQDVELNEEEIKNIDKALALGYKKDEYGRRRGISQEDLEKSKKID